MRRNLTPIEREELYQLFKELGEGDLLDFIHWIQETSKKNKCSHQQTLSILRNYDAHCERTKDVISTNPTDAS